MMPSDVARALRGRRIGRGKWMCKCPAHHEKTGSLSITDMGQGKTRLHCFAGCYQADVLRAVGLTWKDLRPDGDVGAEIKGRLADEGNLERLDRDFGLALWLLAIDHEKKRYWRAAAKRIGTERRELRDQMYPEEKRARDFQERVRKVGWDGIWGEFMESESGHALDRQYGRRDGVHTARESTGTSAGEVRRLGVRHRAPELLHGGLQTRGQDDQRDGRDLG